MSTVTRPCAQANVVFRRLADEEWALFDPVAHHLHTLNLSAAVVWEYCDGTRSIDEVTTVVREAFGTVPGTTRDDVSRLVDWFVAQGLMTWT